MFEIGRLTRLDLGVVGENDTREIQIDVSEWLEKWPEAAIVIDVQKPDESYYPAATDVENGVLKWRVMASDVQIAGRGIAQIRAMDFQTRKIYKSRVVQTIIKESIDEKVDEDAADPFETWVAQSVEAMHNTQNARNEAQAAAGAAEASAEAASESEKEAEAAKQIAVEAAAGAEKDAEAAINASNTAKEAETGAKAAEEAAVKAAREAAEDVRKSIAEDAEAAQEAADSANVAAASAQEAMTHAQAAQEAAANAAQEAAEEAAEEVRQSVAEDAKKAQEAAGQAAGHAKAAQDVLASIPEDYTKLAEDAKTHAPRIVCDTSGAVVSVADAADRDALVLVSSIKPTVDGVSAVTLTRTGRNLVSNLDYIVQNGHSNTVITADVIDVKSPTKFDYGRIPITFKAGVTYTLVIDWEVYGRADAESGNARASYYAGKVGTAATNVYIAGNGSKRTVRQYTFAEDTVGRISWCPNQDGDVAAKSRSRIMLLEGAYTADSAPEFVPCDKQTLTANLPATVYGGTLDWTTGLLTITHGADGAALAAPVTHQLDAQTVEMLKGDNAVWSDTGDTYLVYIADTKIYIDNAVAAIAAAIINA